MPCREDCGAAESSGSGGGFRPPRLLSAPCSRRPWVCIAIINTSAPDKEHSASTRSARPTIGPGARFMVSQRRPSATFTIHQGGKPSRGRRSQDRRRRPLCCAGRSFPASHLVPSCWHAAGTVLSLVERTVHVRMLVPRVQTRVERSLRPTTPLLLAHMHLGTDARFVAQPQQAQHCWQGRLLGRISWRCQATRFPASKPCLLPAAKQGGCERRRRQQRAARQAGGCWPSCR